LFLRVLRLLRLLRAYHVLDDLRELSSRFRRYEEVIDAVINLLVCIFIMSASVFVLQVSHNAAINNDIDALYFTVSTLTTTGFGDIVMSDPAVACSLSPSWYSASPCSLGSCERFFGPRSGEAIAGNADWMSTTSMPRIASAADTKSRSMGPPQNPQRPPS
jgi:hypothetical protein